MGPVPFPGGPLHCRWLSDTVAGARVLWVIGPIVHNSICEVLDHFCVLESSATWSSHYSQATPAERAVDGGARRQHNLLPFKVCYSKCENQRDVFELWCCVHYRIDWFICIWFGKNFTPDALPDETLTIYPGLGPAQGVKLIVLILWLG